MGKPCPDSVSWREVRIAMPVDFKFKAETSSVTSGTQTLAEGAGDWREAWPKMTGQLTQIVSEVFDSQGARGGRDAWAPLSEKYARRKERRYPGQPLLQATRRLWRSLVGEGEDSVEEREPIRLRHGTRVEYAPYLQSGTSRMPPRAIVGLAPRDETSLTSAIKQQALRVGARAGFAVAGAGGSAPLASSSRLGGSPLAGETRPLSGAI